MSESRLTYLLESYFSNNATLEETDELMALLASDNSRENEDHILGVMDRVWETHQASNPVFAVDKSRTMLATIMKTRAIPVVRQNNRKWTWRIAVAAAVLLAGIFGIYTLVNREDRSNKEIAMIPITKPDILPGGNKAVLTLADGSTIILDSAANGTLTQQGNSKIIKLENGQIAYKASGKAEEVIYNTISTPRGGQYQLVLSDGTKVWLNAASSLRYPAMFTGAERKVELTGEGYFEVAKNAAMPFKVDVAGKGEVEVLGTHFNINAYSDEAAISTTLLEGKVKVTGTGSRPDSYRVLTPGQQAQLKANGQIGINNNVDVSEVVAWKNGKFQFGEAADITSIMRQIARWYDLDVEYKGTFTGHIGGTISREVNVSKVFEMLEMTGTAKFQVNGKKVIVLPK